MSEADKQKANQLLQKGHLVEAYKAFKNLIYEYPRDWMVYDGLAYLEQNLNNNLEEAKKLIKKARDYGYPESRYHRVLAEILWSKGQLDKAVLEFEMAVTSDRSIDNLSALADSLMNTNYERAAPIWKEIIEKDPFNVRAYLALAWIAGKHNDWKVVLKMANKANELQPDNARIQFHLGRAYHGLGQYEKALDQYLKADRRGYTEKFFFHANAANCYFELQNYTKALEHSYEAVKLNAQDSRANKLLNRCKECLLWLCGEERNSEAYPMMVIALKIWPNDSRLLAYMASLEITLKHNNDAGESYMEKAFKYNNTDLSLLYEIKGALWYDYLDEKKEGLSCLEKAVSLNRSVFNLVSLASRIIDSDRERAEKIYQDALQIEPENVNVIHGLCQIALKDQNWSKGFRLASKCYELKQDDPDINVLLAYANFNLAEFDKALEFYLKAEKLDFHDKAYIYKSIAECHHKMGDLTKARKYAKRALSINPEDAEVNKLLSDLK